MAAYGKCYDPSGARFRVPTFPWKFAPDGYATRRQLRARGLRPGGQPVAAQVMRHHRGRRGGVQVAYLYRIDLAKPVRPMTSRRCGALALAMLAPHLPQVPGRLRLLPADLARHVPAVRLPRHRFFRQPPFHEGKLTHG